MFRRFLITIPFLLLPTASLALNYPPAYEHATVRVVRPDATFFVHADLADTFRKRVFGLSHRDYLPHDHGMLFVGQTFGSFWMKDTLIPLDIVFIGLDQRVSRIVHDASPCLPEACRTYSAPKNTTFVLEFNAGWASANRLQLGDTITLDF